jgi:hypothetical protein
LCAITAPLFEPLCLYVPVVKCLCLSRFARALAWLDCGAWGEGSAAGEVLEGHGLA